MVTLKIQKKDLKFVTFKEIRNNMCLKQMLGSVFFFFFLTFLLVSHQCFFSLLVKYGEVAAIVVLLVLVFCRRTEEESIPSLLSLSLSLTREISHFSLV